MADQLVPGRFLRTGMSSRFAPQPNPKIFATAVEDGGSGGQKAR